MFITQKHFERALELKNRGLEPWKTYYEQLELLCNKLLTEEIPERLLSPGHGLHRTRCASRYIISLCGMYRLTGRAEYAERAWHFADTAMGWKDLWYDEALGDNWQYDLTTSELAFPLAFLLHWLEDYNDADRVERVIKWVDAKIFAPYLKATESEDPKKRAWWYETTINWNTVCNGGILCLALTLEDRLENAKRIIPVALKGMDAYIAALHGDGSYPEGTGYWVYGSIFLFYGIRWYEAAKNVKHPVFDLDCFNDGVNFVFDFSPDGTALSFGDCNFFNPKGGIYVLTERTGRKDIANRLTHRIMKWVEKYPQPPAYLEETVYMRAHEIFALLCCDTEYDREAAEELDRGPAVAIYRDNGWGIFRSGRLAAAFRAGTSRVNHGMRDLNSIQVEKAGVRLLENKEAHPYPKAWFGATRNQYFEDSSLSKNTMIVDGIGQLRYGDAQWGDDGESMWSDAASVYADYIKKVYRRISRGENCIILEDEFENKPGTGVSWPEMRFVTPGDFERTGHNTWRVTRDGVSAVLEFSCSEELVFQVCDAPGSLINQPVYRILRVSPGKPVARCSFKTIIRDE